MKHFARPDVLLGALVEALPDPIFVIDENGRYLEVLGVDPSNALVGKSVHEIMPQEAADGFLASIQSALDGGGSTVAEYRLGNDHDAPQWFEARIAPLPNAPGRPRVVACLASNITQRKQMQHLLAEAAQAAEAEIGGRTHFMRCLADEIKRQARYKEPFCLLLLDLDHFQAIRDTFGADVGDGCLQEIARIVRQELRHSDVLGRLDDEEFGVLLVNTPMNWGLDVGERIRRRVAYMPFVVPGRTLHLTVSGGLTDFRPSDSPRDMIERARKALLKSQNSGHDRVSVG